jgi:ATP-dependent exoDNAse (exonuclease V) beta subunit
MPQRYAEPSEIDLSFTRDPLFTFDKERHLYHYDGRNLRSAGSVMKELCEPFARDRIARYTAKRRGVTVRQVLAEWEDKRDRAARRGEAIHWCIEQYLQTGLLPAFLPKHVQLDQDDHWDVWRRLQGFDEWYKHNLDGSYVLGQEVRMYSLTLGIAGTTDTLMLRNGYVYVGDWKSNGKFRVPGDGERVHSRMLPPLEHLSQIELHTYSVQVSLYRMMLHEHGVRTAGGFIVHIPEEGPPALHHTLDLRRPLWDYLAAA